jgi:phage terminase large subunit
LRKGALRDWRTIMEAYDLYSVPEHVRTENTYYYPTGSYMEFFSVDDHLKVRGPGRDILFINEANLIDLDTFTQLLLRTKHTAFIDYNPADEFHWIYDKVLTRPDCYFIKSTYKDNPFLPDEQVKEIENLRNMDENFWRIYGEGERGHSEGVIYTHWDTFNQPVTGSVCYGLDFGYSNPTALVRITEKDKEIYTEELLYQSQLTNPELIGILKQILPAHSVVYCDSAEPARIEELRKAGINAKPADKDVKAGILFLKSHKLHVHFQSVNLLKEIKSYKFVGIETKDLVPLKANDHLMDALRYGVTGLRKPPQTYHAPQYIR